MNKSELSIRPFSRRIAVLSLFLILYLCLPFRLWGQPAPAQADGQRSDPPIIQVSATQLTDSLYVGDISVLQFTIRNIQTTPSQLYFSISENPAVDWLSVNPTSGWLTSGQMQVVDVTLDATILANGIYTCQLKIASSDTVHPSLTVDVTLSVFWPTPFFVWPDSLYFSLPPNGQDSANFSIKNGSLDSTNVYYFNTEIYLDTTHWLIVKPDSVSLPPLGIAQCRALVNSAGLLPGHHSGSVVIYSNDPVNPEIHLPRVSLEVLSPPAMQLSLDTLDFDTLVVGQSSDDHFWIRNLGGEDLQIQSVGSTDPNFSIQLSQSTIAPNDSAEATVTFYPQNAGNQSGWIVVSGNDPVNPMDSVFVMGVAYNPGCVQLLPNFVNPISVYEHDSIDIDVTIANSTQDSFAWSAFISRTLLPNPPDLNDNLLFPVNLGDDSLSPDDLFDIQFSIPLSGSGHHGAEFDGTDFYISYAFSGQFERYDLTGTLIETFNIPGVSGTRDLAFDGTYMYGGSSGNTIYVMDFITKILIGTIPAPVSVTHIAYDEGQDAFWVGGWNTDLVLVDRWGTVLNTIPIGAAGINLIFGSAYDDWNPGGPYLWVFGEPPGGGMPTYVSQIDLSTGLLTGITHDVASDFTVTNPGGGGLFTTEGIVNNEATLGGVLRGSPETVFAYELVPLEVPWLKLFLSGGIVPPNSYVDVPIRVYGSPAGRDTAYIVFQALTPPTAQAQIEVIRQVLITGLDQLTFTPTEYHISQNYPNPFNPTTRIDFQLPRASEVTLDIYDALGRRVRQLTAGRHPPGYYSVEWNGRDDAGNPAANGIYVYRFRAGDFHAVRKMVLLR